MVTLVFLLTFRGVFFLQRLRRRSTSDEVILRRGLSIVSIVSPFVAAGVVEPKKAAAEPLPGWAGPLCPMWRSGGFFINPVGIMRM
jgi:hypothetical protein